MYSLNWWVTGDIPIMVGNLWYFCQFFHSTNPCDTVKSQLVVVDYDPLSWTVYNHDHHCHGKHLGWVWGLIINNLSNMIIPNCLKTNGRISFANVFCSYLALGHSPLWTPEQLWLITWNYIWLSLWLSNSPLCQPLHHLTILVLSQHPGPRKIGPFRCRPCRSGRCSSCNRCSWWLGRSFCAAQADQTIVTWENGIIRHATSGEDYK